MDGDASIHGGMIRQIHRSSLFLSTHDVFFVQHFFTQPHQIAVVVDPIAEAGDDIGIWGWKDGSLCQRNMSLVPQEAHHDNR